MAKRFLFLVIAFMISINLSGQKKVIIDADTANEVDDIVAIARALMSDKIEVIGLTAAQWGNEDSWMKKTAHESWELNNSILELLNRMEIPSMKGSESKVRYRWDGTDMINLIMVPQPSPAADFIAEKAREMSEGEKITILVLGAITNVASAILQYPDIVPKISVHYIGTLFDLEKNVWNKNEFNTRNDLNALDAVLNTPGLELHIMPANVTVELSFKNKSSIERLENIEGITRLFLDIWKEKVPEPNDNWGWIMWDVALIHAIINPDWVEKKSTTTPPENLHRTIMVYTKIDVEKMKDDFWMHFGNKHD